MRMWVQVFSAKDRNPNYHIALEKHLRSVVEPGVELDIHGTHKGGLAEQFRFFQTVDTPDMIDSILTCKNAKGDQQYDAFVTLNSTDPALYEAREILDIPVVGFLETTALLSCMMGRSFSLIVGNSKFALSYSQKIKAYGLTERLASIEAMNYPYLLDFRNAYTDPAANERVMTEFDQVARRAIAAGAEVIIPCGQHAVLQAQRGLRELDGAVILDGLAVTMKMAETAVKIQQTMGTFVSRKLLYQKPSEQIRQEAKKEYRFDL